MTCGGKDTLANRGFDDVELAGRLVRLRPTRAADAVRGYELIHHKQDILRWLCWDGPASVEEMAQTYGVAWPEKLRAGTGYAFAIEERGRPGLVGCIDARIVRHPQQLEIGYWLGIPYWGRGYTSEALALLCYFCFQHLGAQVVQGSAFVGNLASRRVQEKNGFRFEGTLRRAVRKGEAWVDLWHTSLLREEWEALQFRPAVARLVPHDLEQELSGLFE